MKRKVRLVVSNPACGGRKPVELITDRAKRYRANSAGCKPDGPKRCLICHNPASDVMHMDGDESNGKKKNLAWGCRSCNTRLGAMFKKLGRGVRTRQFNSAGSGGAKSLGAWLSAIQIAKYGAVGDLGEALDTIRNTPAAARARYSAQAWAARRKLYGSSGRSQSEIPF